MPEGMPQEMPPKMPEEKAPEAGGEFDQEGLKGLIVGINNNMLKFKQVLGGVPEVSDDVKGQLDGLIQQYQDFVMNLSKMGAGEAPEAPEMEEAPAAPKARGPMPMNAGPGAKPAL